MADTNQEPATPNSATLTRTVEQSFHLHKKVFTPNIGSTPPSAVKISALLSTSKAEVLDVLLLDKKGRHITSTDKSAEKSCRLHKGGPVMEGIHVLIEEKEKELTALSGRRVQGLEARTRSLAEELRMKESENATVRNQLSQLTSDFKYNLQLLEERDAELEKQDQEIAAFKKGTAELERALQEARKEGVEWEREAEKRQQRGEELERAVEAYQEVVGKVRDQLEEAKRTRDKEVEKQASEMGVLKAHVATLTAQHEIEIEGAIKHTEERFKSTIAAMEKRVFDQKGSVEEVEGRRQKEVQILIEELEELRRKAEEKILEEQEKRQREAQSLQKVIDDLNVKMQNVDTRHQAQSELLRQKLAADYQSALLKLQEEHQADVSAQKSAHERERELAERQRVAEIDVWAEERLTLSARLESAEREVRSGSVKWEDRVRALQEERKHSEQQEQALRARVEELERAVNSQSQELDSAHKQSHMLQTLVDDLHAALQSKDASVRSLQKKLEEVEAAKGTAIAALEREKAEAEVSLRQQLLGEYESKVAELLDTLRTMKEHVASENEQNAKKLQEQVEAHENVSQDLQMRLEESELKQAENEKELAALKEQLQVEREDAQFVKSTLAARNAEVELLRGEVGSIQKEVQELSEEREALEMKREEDERFWTQGVSVLRKELSEKEGELKRLARTLRAQEVTSGPEHSRDGQATGNQESRESLKELALLRKLAAENEELRQRFGGHTPGVKKLKLNPQQEWSPNQPDADMLLDARRVAENTRAGAWHFQERRISEGPNGRLLSAESHSLSPAVAELYEEIQALRSSLGAVRSSHVAADKALRFEDQTGLVSDSTGTARELENDEGLHGGLSETSQSREVRALQDELQKLRNEVRAASQARAGRYRPESQLRQDQREDKSVQALYNEVRQLRALISNVSQIGQAGSTVGSEPSAYEAALSKIENAQKAEALGVLEGLRESVASLRAELDCLQEAKARETRINHIDAPFVTLEKQVDEGWLSQPPTRFSKPHVSEYLSKRKSSDLKATSQKMTSAEETAILRRQNSQLTKEVTLLKGAGRSVDPGGHQGGSKGQHSNVEEQLAGDSLKARVVEAIAGRSVRIDSDAASGGWGKGMVLAGKERFAPSDLLRQEIADARAELEALRSAQSGTEIQQKPTERYCHVQFGTPLLTWTDLAGCVEGIRPKARLEETTDVSDSQRLIGPAQSSETATNIVSPKSRPSPSGAHKVWVPSSGTNPAKGTRTSSRVQVKPGSRVPALDRREKQNKVGYPPRTSRVITS